MYTSSKDMTYYTVLIMKSENTLHLTNVNMVRHGKVSPNIKDSTTTCTLKNNTFPRVFLAMLCSVTGINI